MPLHFKTTVENYLIYNDDSPYGQIQLFTNFAIDYIQNYKVCESFVNSIKQVMIEISQLEKKSNVLEIETLESQSKKISEYINRINSIKHTEELSNFFLLQEEELNSKFTEINKRISELNNIIKSIDGFVDLMFRSINHTYLCKGDHNKKEQTEDDFTDNEIQQYADLISEFVKDVRKALE